MKRNILETSIASRDIEAFNDQGNLFPRFTGNPGAHGTVCAANDSNFDADHLSVPLNEFIVGAPEDEGLLDILEAIAPSIPTARAFSYRTHDTKEQFQSDSDDDGDIREIGGDFSQVKRTGTKVDGRTDNKGLIMVLDNDQGGEDAAVQQRAVLNLRSRLLRSDLRRCMTALLAAANNTAKNWGGSATAPDPDVDLLEAVDRGGDARGVDSNLVILGGSARIKRVKCLRGKTNPDMVGASLSNAQLAEFLGVDNVITLRNRYQSSATAKSKILGDLALALQSRKGAMPDDPSNIKRFVTMTPSGMVRVYVQLMLKKTLVAVEHYSRVVITSTLGIEKLTITYT